MNKKAFTLLELIFVIVILGVLSKFGFEFLNQAYKSYIFSQINNTLQEQSEAALETIAARLTYRIKDSAIAREDASTYEPVASSTLGESATILEWVGYDIDGFRGGEDNKTSNPLWSGVIDLDLSSATILESHETNTSRINDFISELSYGNSSINDAALYFVGSSSDVYSGYGWSGAITDHNSSAMHPINAVVGQPTQFASGIGGVNFSGTDVYEYYQLAWSAYAIVHSADGNLTLHYDYQPWRGESYTDGKSQLLMQKVDTFRFIGVGSIIKIQVCVNSDLVEDYSLCKEKTVF